MSYAIKRFLGIFFSKPLLPWLHLVICLVLAFFSGMAWYVSTLIPDVFTPILILLMLSLVFRARDRFSGLDGGIIAIILPMHSSHVVFLMLLMALFLVCLFLPHARRWMQASRKALLFLCLSLACGYALGLVLNLRGGGKAEFSRGSHMFLVARLCGDGILKDYLAEKCNDENTHLSLCKRKNSLPQRSDIFLWNDSVYYDKECLAAGGWGNCWEKRKDEYWGIFTDVLSTYPFNLRWFSHVLSNTFSQFTTYRVDPVFAQPENLPFKNFIQLYFPSDLPHAEASAQWKGVVRYDKLSFLQNVLLGLSTLCLVFALLKKKNTLPGFGMIFLLTTLALLANSFICGAFSDVVPRYQGRLIWLFPLLALVFLAHLISSKKQA
jgi:hypothetical protein